MQLHALTVAGAAQVAESASTAAQGPCFPFNPPGLERRRAPTWRADYRRAVAPCKMMEHMQNVALLLDASLILVDIAARGGGVQFAGRKNRAVRLAVRAAARGEQRPEA